MDKEQKEMANLIQKTILHPENSKEVDLYPKTSYEQVEGLDGIIAGINNKIDKIPIGEKVSFVFPKNAVNGNITDEQLSTLQANDANYIEMVNDKELYYLNDNGHVEGYLTYSHVGIENNQATIKTLTITVSAKSFVIVTTVVPTDAGGGKLYLHTFSIIYPGASSGLQFHFYKSNITHITKEEFESLISGGFIAEKGDSWEIVYGRFSDNELWFASIGTIPDGTIVNNFDRLEQWSAPTEYTVTEM